MRLRLRYSKLGRVRFTSHRDVARMWERALRRAALPVAYTQGFSPRPKIAFGLALPTGHESLAEYLDVELADDPLGPVEDLPGVLKPCLPGGIDVTAAAVVATGDSSLQEAVRSCSWRIEALGVDPRGAGHLVERLLAADEVVVTRERKGRQVIDDLRPAVLSLGVRAATASGVELDAELAVHPRSVRPHELLEALSSGAHEGRVVRTVQWIWRDGAREEPLTAAASSDATPAPHAWVRAS